MTAPTPADRQTAKDMLRRFVPNAGPQYAKNRNFDYGPGDRSNVSVLSPYVRHRLLLETELLEAVLKEHAYGDAQKFIDEVFWRTYFKGWLEHHPVVWTNYLADVSRAVRRLNEDQPACDRYNEVVSARTGIDCFDAWVDELTTTGYLHNHARMWFASIWVYTLQLPWQLGADFFLRNLLDGDPASNTLGWRWVCGLHTRGKTYLARVSNITNFSNYRFNPRGRLATSAPPLSEDVTIQPTSPGPADVEPSGPFGLLVTEEDCTPERALLRRAPEAVLGLSAVRHRSILPVSPAVFEFSVAAVADGARRAAGHWDVEATCADDADWSETLLSWCAQHGLRQVVTAWAPVGPVATRLDAVEKCLAENGIELFRVRRDYDEQAWPHAAKGYFKLKRQVPELLTALGIDTDVDKPLRRTG